MTYENKAGCQLKRVVSILLLLVLLLSGCTGKNEELERAMALRADMLGKSVCFDAKVTADYGDQSYTFVMNCQADTQGNLTFAVTEPETIAGITGNISATGGALTFDGTALAFELMADGLLTPVSGPWVLIKTLRGGYLTSCNLEDGLLRVAIDDSYEEDPLHLDIWLDENDLPKLAEIYWQGRRLLTIHVSNFTYV